ncbi:MAG: exodeoxyribonuclease V subunit gamma [Solirubrobacterales bacterium]|nr:MAG: exodeoxyribonuclease V subunit gamma [Solirubrobacterales bacterium]
MLHVHRAERADLLADGLAQTLLEPLEDPFVPEVVAVPTRGIERWLGQRLSTRLGAGEDRCDGVCANVEFPFPGRLVLGALASATGLDPDDDPWPAERSVWPLLEVVDRSLKEPWLAIIAVHLAGARGGGEDPSRRFGVVRRIADLFDRYGVHRPEMLNRWAQGEATDGSQDAWQAELWRALRERIDTPSPAERLVGACGRIREEPQLLDLPARVSLFGLTRMPRSYLDVLAAIAWARDVHLFVLHPSPSLWGHVREALQDGAPVVHRRADRTAELPANRLLASWGRDARELQLVLAATGESVDHHHPLGSEGNTTLLQRIQADVREDRQPSGPPLPGELDARPSLDRADRSVQVHACHGRARQVEVLRDAVLHELEEDATLEPRDVIVMCPDIETFAPLIQATFGAGRVEATAGGAGATAGWAGATAGAAGATASWSGDEDELQGRRLPDLRVRLADRSLRQTNPLLGVISQLLELADQRATASALLDLADCEPVRRRFRFDDDELTRMQDWVVASGIRWGLDAAHRAPFKLDVLAAGTWRAGLDRILLGVTMTEEDRRLVGGVLPLDDVESGAIELAGRFAEYVDRVRAAVDELSGAKAIDGWAAVIAGAADALTATSERDSWQRRELGRVLDDVLAEARQDGQLSGVPLELADLRALLADRLRGRPTRASFRTGHLTICTLVPMRSVPHRVVCILGLDDGQFPRRAWRDGDDLMLSDPQVGDRDPRTEDRQMLLDALLAATERLIITYTGSDERTNLPRPPAVPVGELLDIVERTVRREHGSAREQVLVGHPLQPFDRRNFTKGTLVPKGPWSFDQVSLDGARALSRPRDTPASFLSVPLPAPDDGLVELENLVRFVEQPVRAFLRGRLGIAVREFADEVDDALPIELDGLGEWGVGQRLLDGVLAGAGLDECVQAELARGMLPPGMLAMPVLDRIRVVVEQIAGAARASGDGKPTSLDVNVRIADGRMLAGTVPGVCGGTIRRVSYARVKPRDRLAAWVRLLALSAACPERRLQSVVIGRARSGARDADVTLARIPALGDDPVARRREALDELAVLVDLYERGMREPLPVASGATAAYAQAAVAGADAEAAARGVWETTFGYDKEDREPEHVLVHGGAITLAELLDEAPRADEQGEGWDQSEPTRFGRYARRLWDGLLAREVVRDR